MAIRNVGGVWSRVPMITTAATASAPTTEKTSADTARRKSVPVMDDER